ncbi:hypothetical protein G9A89_017706 [Geosiphon pyriformis]|nr:hypothetical protein G9A89_017706 [Geosiphon pyriformis]
MNTQKYQQLQHYINIQLVITEPKKETILFNMHSDPIAEHFHKEATMEKTRKKYYWPSMYPNIIQYVQNCNACQRRERTRPSEPLRSIKVGQPFDHIGIDLVRPLLPNKIRDII